MKILFPALRYDYGKAERGESLEKRFFFPALVSTGNDVVPFWLEDHFYGTDPERLQRALISYAEKERPDLIFFMLMQGEIFQETLCRLKNFSYTMNWFGDDQWRFETFSKNYAPLFDIIVTTDIYSILKYHNLGCCNVFLSQWGSPLFFDEIPTCSGTSSGVASPLVSFVGGYNTVREWYIEKLRKSGIQVECYGSGWKEGRVSFDKMASMFKNSVISLNLSNSIPNDLDYLKYLIEKFCKAVAGVNAIEVNYFYNLKLSIKALISFFRTTKRVEQVKARNFEIPASGGFQVAQFAPGIENYFIPGKEIVLFSSASELGPLVRFYLDNTDIRENIRRAGIIRSYDHTYTNRIQYLLVQIDPLLKTPKATGLGDYPDTKLSPRKGA